ncbi:MAG: RnfABCDGE type electron transport complex subunit D [Erysipelotrichaceae bacterium]|jgi:RnfABCDGE-type electron transport complex D subunit|nr:RnfABCDGE type electron transport complex subunit D [Erysipelotrichaceae bacterium]
MKFTYRPSPNYRQPRKTRGIMMELTIGLLAVAAFSCFYYFTKTDYGLRVIELLFVSVLFCVLTEAVWAYFTKEKVLEYLKHSFPWVTGIILALILPINATLYATAISAVLAIFFGKLVFGGFGQNVFNPAGVGRAFFMTSFATSVAADVVSSPTPITTMSTLGWVIKDSSLLSSTLSQFGGLTNLFVGFYPGSIGETSALVILIVGAVLIWRKVIDWRIPVVYVGCIFIFTALVGAMQGMGLWYPLYHVFTGGVLFGAVFMLTDPVTNPTAPGARVVFGIGAAIITLLIRFLGNLPEGVVFSILIMNMINPMIEAWMDGKQIHTIKKSMVTSSILVVLALALFTGVGLSLKPKAAEAEVPEEPEEPALVFGQPIALNSTSLDPYKGEITGTSESGSYVVYTVKVKGYGLVDDDGSHGLSYDYNIFDITVDPAAKTLVSIAYQQFGDTKNIGSKTENEDYYKVFEGLDLTNYDNMVDTVSGATCTSKSMISAVRIVMDALGE